MAEASPAKMAWQESVDTRVIHSKGKYDIDEELLSQEYPEDFVYAIHYW